MAKPQLSAATWRTMGLQSVSEPRVRYVVQPKLADQGAGRDRPPCEGMAERFEAATAVSLRCEWYVLSARHLYDPQANWFDERDARGDAHGDHRIASRTWPVGTLNGGWAEIVAELIAPVMRIFAPDFKITTNWVHDEVARMNKIYASRFGRG
jgi:hypothetical protein